MVPRPLGNHTRATPYIFSHLHQNLRFFRQPNIYARAKPHQADAFTAYHLFALLLPRDYAPGDESRNLLEDHFAGFGRKRKHVLLVFKGGALAHRGQEFPRAVIHFRNGSGSRRAVHVHVPDGQKNAYALAGTAGILFFGDHHNSAIGGRYDGTGFRRNHTVRITKEGENKQSEKHQHSRRQIPVKEKSYAAKHEKRQPKEIAFFDHAEGFRPPPFRSRLGCREHARSFYDSFLGREAGIAWISLLSKDARSNPLHLILAVELHFFQLNFFQEVL